MVKLKGPLFSVDARGTLGKKIIYTRGGFARNYFKPRNPNSAAQQAQREAFKEFSVPGLTQEQADLLYSAIAHDHEGLYSLIDHEHGAGNVPRCQVRKSTAQGIAYATVSTISWDVEVFDTNGMHDNSTNNSRMTINTGGVYLCSLQVVWASNNTGVRQVFIQKNGNTDLIVVIFPNNVAGEDQNYIFTVADLDEGDYIEGKCWQGSGGTLNIQGGRGDVSFTAVKIA